MLATPLVDLGRLIGTFRAGHEPSPHTSNTSLQTNTRVPTQTPTINDPLPLPLALPSKANKSPLVTASAPGLSSDSDADADADVDLPLLNPDHRPHTVSSSLLQKNTPFLSASAHLLATSRVVASSSSSPSPASVTGQAQAAAAAAAPVPPTVDHAPSAASPSHAPVPVSDGPASILFHSGARYVGPLSHGEMHGPNGSYTWPAPSSTKFRGDFVHNRIHGKGTYTWKDGSTYTGNVRSNTRSGQGELKLSTGVRVVGTWQDGRLHGTGTITYSPTSNYTGGFQYGLRHGHGTMHYPSGAQYTGHWLDGARHGHGKMTWTRPVRAEYTGGWQLGKMHGQGTYVWDTAHSNEAGDVYACRNWYTGGFVGGKREGQGIMHYADGAEYNGEFANNMKHGKGVFRDRFGRVYPGEWVNDQMVKCNSGNGGPWSSTESPPTYFLPFSAEDLAPLASIIRRHMPTLTRRFATYTRLHPHLLNHATRPCGLSRAQFAVLLADCGLRTHLGISLVHMDATITAVLAQLPAFPHSRSTLHFADYLAAVTAVARHLYARPGVPSSVADKCAAVPAAHLVIPGRSGDDDTAVALEGGSVLAVALDRFVTYDLVGGYAGDEHGDHQEQIALAGGGGAGSRPASRAGSASVRSAPSGTTEHVLAAYRAARADVGNLGWMSKSRRGQAAFWHVYGHGDVRGFVERVYAKLPEGGWDVAQVLRMLCMCGELEPRDIGSAVHALGEWIRWVVREAVDYPVRLYSIRVLQFLECLTHHHVEPVDTTGAL
ncbi:hypothetical protein BCR44DRAFT_1040667 [Catenaria anguillulae PL171]|uniref:MORN repeat-containing protein n=1 Tax=Catenaria anguillulae PL171 TaxID=765915 RepID=A0A1Y2H5J0_9FUNG|nr:hypothetical protein BCR44DRAFT_1040667 [Catenaria anguillulae PL171]